MKIKKIIVVIGFLILTPLFLLFISNLTKQKITLESKYYKTGKFIDINGANLNELLNNKENFILYTYNNFCTFKVSCDEIFNESIKELNITILKIPFDEFKTTSLYNEVNYAPSVILIKEGKIIEYIDPEKNDDLSKYQDKKEFISWIKEYINI